MTSLEQLLEKLERQITIQAIHDGFPSEEIRRSILGGIKHLKLGKYPKSIYRNSSYSEIEKLKIEYLRDAENAGALLAQKYIANKIILPADHFLRPIINAGMDSLGRTIARSYASEIYPELRCRRLNGEKDPDFSRRKPLSPKTFGFTVDSDRDIYDLSAIHAMTGEPGSHVYYDEICDRHTETFLFASIEDADTAHWNWERFIRRQVPRPPVKYAVRIEVDSLDEIFISTVLHADLFEKSRAEFTPDGSAVKWEVCDSLEEAEILRRERLKERQPEADKDAVPITSAQPEQERSRSPERPKEKHALSHAPKKTEKNNLSISK